MISLEIIANNIWHHIPVLHPRKWSSHFIKWFFKLSVYICEKPASLAYQDREQLMDKPILAWKIKQNTGTKDTKFTINRKPEPEHIFAFSFFFMILVMHRKRGKDEHKYFILPSPQSFNSAPSDLYRWSTMFATSSDNFNNLLHELHSRKSTSVCYRKTMLNIDWHDILFLLYFDEFFQDN